MTVVVRGQYLHLSLESRGRVFASKGCTALKALLLEFLSFDDLLVICEELLELEGCFHNAAIQDV